MTTLWDSEPEILLQSIGGRQGQVEQAVAGLRRNVQRRPLNRGNEVRCAIDGIVGRPTGPGERDLLGAGREAGAERNQRIVVKRGRSIGWPGAPARRSATEREYEVGAVADSIKGQPEAGVADTVEGEILHVGVLRRGIDTPDIDLPAILAIDDRA